MNQPFSKNINKFSYRLILTQRLNRYQEYESLEMENNKDK